MTLLTPSISSTIWTRSSMLIVEKRLKRTIAASLITPTITSPYFFASLIIFKCPSCIISVQKQVYTVAIFPPLFLTKIINIVPVLQYDDIPVPLLIRQRSL